MVDTRGIDRREKATRDRDQVVDTRGIDRRREGYQGQRSTGDYQGNRPQSSGQGYQEIVHLGRVALMEQTVLRAEHALQHREVNREEEVLVEITTQDLLIVKNLPVDMDPVVLRI